MNKTSKTTTYSHSRISTFNHCKYKYKLQYVDKIKVDIPGTIETFMGDLVHQALQKLYADLKYEKRNTKEDILAYFNELWEKEYTQEIIIAKKDLTAENYRLMGEKYLSTYYDEYAPFDQLTILGLETQDRMILPDGNSYHVRIDKLACKGDTYYVCDYKTNAQMKDQQEADADRQLAMYSIWVKDRFKDAKEVVLVWHMLAFNKEATSKRSDEELQALQDEIVANIKEIEECKEYPTNVTPLCNYCVYQSICPSFKHAVELEKKPLKEFKEDDGLKLVDEYASLDFKEKEAKKQKEAIKEDLISFAKQKEIDAIYGSNKKVSVKPYDKVILPKDEDFLNLLKEKGIYQDVTMLSYPKLSSLILKKQVDDDIINKVEIDKEFKVTLGKRKDL